MGRGRARKLVRFPAQNGPGPPRARRPWPFAHGKFPHAECAKAAARATALPSCAAHFPTQNRRMGPGRLARGGPALRAQCGSPTRMGSCSACCPAKNWPGRSARGGRESCIAPDRKHTPEPRLTWKSNRSPVRFHFISRPTWRLVHCGYYRTLHARGGSSELSILEKCSRTNASLDTRPVTVKGPP